MSTEDDFLAEYDRVVNKHVEEYEKTYGKCTSFEDVSKIIKWLNEKHPEVCRKLEQLFLKYFLKKHMERLKRALSMAELRA